MKFFEGGFSSKKEGENKSEEEEQVFKKTLANEGQEEAKDQDTIDEMERRVNLQDEINLEIEETTKEGVMKAREVFLEQVRAVEVVREKFEALQDPGAFDEYIASIGVGDGVKEDLRSAIPAILETLSKSQSELFGSEIFFEEYDAQLYQYIAGNLRLSMNDQEFDAATRAIFESEVDLAVQILDASRRRPVLAHRVRGFFKDEASKEGLTKALEENVEELEFDIRMSKDHTPIIHHNATLGASSDRAEAVCDLSDAEIKEVEMKNGGHIVGLREFFDAVEQTENKVTKINIDIKDFDRAMLDEVLSLIKERKMEHRVQIVSWLPQCLQYLYEKDPTLPYSMSYYPVIRGVSRVLIEHLVRHRAGSFLAGKFATEFARRRAEAVEDGEPAVQGTGSEVISDTYLLDANEYWEAVEKGVEERGEDLVGLHTMGFSDTPILENKQAETMARVLRRGSVNVMAMEEMMSTLFEDRPILRGVKNVLIKMLGRGTKMLEYAKTCAKNGVKVNLFDLKKGGDVESHFKHFESGKVQAGTVYSSNPDLVRRLDSRDKTPLPEDIKNNPRLKKE